MKTATSEDRAAEQLQRYGRRPLAGRGGGAFGGVAPAAPASPGAGTSALIGCCLATAESYRRARKGRPGRIDWLTDQSINWPDWPERAEGTTLDFALNDEQQEYKERCRTFAREVIRPAARKHDEEESTPWEVIKEARKQGFGGLEGIQRSAADPQGQMSVISAEEFHWGCAGTALAVSGSGLAAAGIASSGTPDQIARWVPECFGSGDDIKLGAYAVTEPQAGSDVKSLKTTAKRDGDEWVLNGTKVFITNGGIADVHVVVATVDPELGTRGQASFVVGKDTPGAQPGEKGVEARHPRLAHRRGRPRGLPDPGREPARRRGEAPEEARARPLGAEIPLRRRRPRDLRDDPAAGRRLGARHRPGGVRVDARVPARPLRRRHARCSSSSGSSRRSPTSPPRSKPRACWSSVPPGWGATGSR